MNSDNGWKFDDPRLTEARRASMFTAFIWYNKDQDKGDQKHSNKMEVTEKVIDIKLPPVLRTNHEYAYWSLRRMLQKSDHAVQGSRPLKFGYWSRAIIYENIFFKPVFKATPGHISYEAVPDFLELETGAKLLKSWHIQYEGETRISLVPINLVKIKAQFNWDYYKKVWMKKEEEAAA